MAVKAQGPWINGYVVVKMEPPYEDSENYFGDENRVLGELCKLHDERVSDRRMDDSPKAFKRNRNCMNGRTNWTDDSKVFFADFCLMEHLRGRFEKPSQKAFVRRFRDHDPQDAATEIGQLQNADENKIACLLNAMKKRYKETKDWMGEEVVGVHEKDLSKYNANVKKRCPYYDQFDKILGGGQPAGSLRIYVGTPDEEEADESRETVEGQNVTAEPERLPEQLASKVEPVVKTPRNQVSAIVRKRLKRIRGPGTVDWAASVARRTWQRESAEMARIRWEREKWEKEKVERDRKFELEKKIALGNLELQIQKMKYDAEERQKQREHDVKIKEMEITCLKLKLQLVQDVEDG